MANVHIKVFSSRISNISAAKFHDVKIGKPGQIQLYYIDCSDIFSGELSLDIKVFLRAHRIVFRSRWVPDDLHMIEKPGCNIMICEPIWSHL